MGDLQAHALQATQPGGGGGPPVAEQRRLHAQEEDARQVPHQQDPDLCQGVPPFPAQHGPGQPVLPGQNDPVNVLMTTTTTTMTCPAKQIPQGCQGEPAGAGEVWYTKNTM